MSKKIKLPGLIDTHVHLREPGASHKENFETGTKAAIAGGFTQVIDMPNNPEPTITPEALENKIELATNRIYCDVGFHYGGTIESSEMFDLISDRVYGLKVYMNHTTGNLLVDDEEAIDLIFSRWPQGNKPILVHAESVTLELAIKTAKKYDQILHVCHVSLEDELKQIKKAKEEGMNITCEVTPHHLFLNEDDVERLGTFGLMKPPLSSKKDQQALWSNLNIIDIIGSDHAPHLKEEKQSQNPPFGVPNLDTTTSLMLSAVNDGRIPMEKFVDMCATKPRQIFGVAEQTDTYIEVDMDYKGEINSANLKTKAGWTPFEGMPTTARVIKTVLRGKEVYDGENIIGEPNGKII